MGLPHDEQNPYKRDTILDGSWDKISYTGEIGMPNFRTSNFDKKNNEIELRLNLDLLDEKRERAVVCQTTYTHQVTKYYNQRVKHRSFLLGDLVLRKVTLTTKGPNVGKLGPLLGKASTRLLKCLGQEFIV